MNPDTKYKKDDIDTHVFNLLSIIVFSLFMLILLNPYKIFELVTSLFQYK
ncbi:hypothetical protein ACMGD3_23945 [Lysinibacillus sphaericus]